MKKQTQVIFLIAILSILGFILTGCHLIFHSHEYGEWTLVKKPTCIENGIQVRYCDCGEQQVLSIAATGHNYEAVVTEPNCWDKGFTTHTCVDCGDQYVDTYTDELGHTYSNEVCSVCGFGTPSEGLYFIHSTVGDYYILAAIGSCEDKYIVIPSTYEGKPVRRIADSAFASCDQLKVVVVPSSVKYIGKYAFSKCNNLMYIIFEAPAYWYCAQVDQPEGTAMSGGYSMNLNVPAKNVGYFTDSYLDYCWYMKD